MTRLSKYKLTPKVKKDLTENFFGTLGDLNDETQKNFLNQILTPTEIETFAKRLAILKELQAGKTYSEIKETVKVTGSTISKMHNILFKADEAFLDVLDRLLKDEKLIQDWEKDSKYFKGSRQMHRKRLR